MIMIKNLLKIDVKSKQSFYFDKDVICVVVKKIDDGVVIEGYCGNCEEVVVMLNDVLVIELLCVMCYKCYYYIVKGLNVEVIKGEFLVYVQEE